MPSDMGCKANDRTVQCECPYHFPHIFYIIEMYFLWRKCGEGEKFQLNCNRLERECFFLLARVDAESHHHHEKRIRNMQIEI